MATNSLQAIRLHDDDPLVIAADNLQAGAQIMLDGHEPLALVDSIPKAHKVATRSIGPGEPVRRYGQVIGFASQVIAPGAHIHSHNLDMGNHKAWNDRSGMTAGAPVSLPRMPAGRSFAGFHRPDGKVGTRNYLGVVTSVNCSGSVARFIAEEAIRTGLLDAFAGIDGIAPIVHGTGCGMASDDEGYDTLHRTLSGYIQHPNFGGVLLVGLGCEMMQVADLVGRDRPRADGSFRYMTIQQSGGTKKTVERGVAMLRELAEVASRARRAPAGIDRLVLGLQCGGSDGYSGMTANPALGHASDLIVAAGGTTILSETPEIYGAEHLLTARAQSQGVADRLMERIDWWERYTAMHGGKMDNNPSPGNKRGGLTTILEKSLGAVAKSGSAPLSAVLKYGEPVNANGFVFMDSPGYDPCSVTGQIASGANLVAFTTGRGSVSGYMPTPCLKLATNSEMYARMADDMDVNCGDILSGGVSLAEKGAAILDQLIAVASGEETKSEQQGFGGVEFVPWQLGAVM
ncbi:MAG: altronate dehydratase [Roseitalea sp.]|jgi:altronate hydrolase/galactarate dehydratase|nr:altronate dehydratase [Roseitalea sp.]MBO6721490.1 altronate dehydratase [Roseitalea sp.]MBO6742047.1 altronate dehydratase [Roseitalea sp.]